MRKDVNEVSPPILMYKLKSSPSGIKTNVKDKILKLLEVISEGYICEPRIEKKRYGSTTQTKENIDYVLWLHTSIVIYQKTIKSENKNL